MTSRWTIPARCAADEPRQDRIHDRDRLRDREPALFAQQLAQRDAGQVLHDEIRHVAVLALIEDVDDVRVGEARGRARLLDEAALEDGVVAQVAVHDLERDPPLESQVGRHVHGRHPAARNARADPVSAVDESADERVGLLTRAHAESLRTGTCEDAERLTPLSSARRASADGGKPRPGRLLPLRVRVGIGGDLNRLSRLREAQALPSGDVEESPRAAAVGV